MKTTGREVARRKYKDQDEAIRKWALQDRKNTDPTLWNIAYDLPTKGMKSWWNDLSFVWSAIVISLAGSGIVLCILGILWIAILIGLVKP